jgi:hypothetical protein
MKRFPVFALILAFTGVVHASDNSLEVVGENAPADQQTQLRSFENWHRKAACEDIDSDPNFVQWRYKFEGGSDKPLGSPADTAAIKALVLPTIPPTIRWVSRSIVVVASVCRSEASSSRPGRCLYVFEKHDSKWRLIHHYRWRPPVF